MIDAPANIGGARVFLYAIVSDQTRQTGNCRHYINDQLVGPVAGLAICQFDGDVAFYLFGCDEEWNCVTDTYHQTIEDAKWQAEFEYKA